MSNNLKIGDTFYRIWKDAKNVYGEMYTITNILNNGTIVAQDRKCKSHYISSRDTNIILDKEQAISRYNTLKLIEANIAQPKPIKTTKNQISTDPNRNKFNTLHKGQIVYIVTYTQTQPITTQYTVEKLLYDSLSVMIRDNNGKQKKIYLNSLSTLLTKAEADKKIKDFKPITIADQSTNIETRCHHCGETIVRSKSNYCPTCNAHKCYYCGSCLCNYGNH